MTKAAMTELQQQIEEVRREAYAAGYAAAMQVILDAASRPAPKAGTAAAAPGRRGRGRVRQAAPGVKPTRPRRTRATGGPARRGSSANGRAQRGTNALIIEEILKAMTPSGVRPAEIRKALQDNGVAIYPSPRSTTRCANWKRATQPSRSATAKVGVIAAAQSETALSCAPRIGALFMPARIVGRDATVRAACRI
jgi:hypothetical protein